MRERLDHPVIDGDGHTVEFMPLVLDYMREIGGEKFVERYLSRMPAQRNPHDGGPERMGGTAGWYGLSPQRRRELRVTRPNFWPFPTGKVLDRATVMLPALFRERMDELGIDFAVVYTTQGLNLMRTLDEEIRRVGIRALNTMYADLYGANADRMTVPAVIPMYTPAEALEEIDHAVHKLGMKAVVLGTCVRRPIAEVARVAPEAAPYATWMDVIGHGSEYDYDPVWQRCVDLKLAVAVHTGSIGWGARTSVDNFVYNHIGHFAAAGEAFCKAIVLGGVARRFPTLKFAFLEGGAGWATNLYNDLIEHFETRNLQEMRKNLDPQLLDQAALEKLFEQYGGERFAGRRGQGNQAPREDPREIDDWAASGITKARDLADVFENFFFGCEGEDRMTAVAFNRKLNHFGIKLQAFFSSDIGHFDVTDITSILAEAYELVEDDLLTDEDFRDFSFSNVAKLYAGMNPDFFKGTVVEDAVRNELVG